ncbi:branched-chain amino acid transport system II carrier protein [Shigella flexneri]
MFNAARSGRPAEARVLTRYTVWAGLMAGVGLTLLYLALFRLGSDSTSLVNESANGGVFCVLTFSTTLAGAVVPAGGVNAVASW